MGILGDAYESDFLPDMAEVTVSQVRGGKRASVSAGWFFASYVADATYADLARAMDRDLLEAAGYVDPERQWTVRPNADGAAPEVRSAAHLGALLRPRWSGPQETT